MLPQFPSKGACLTLPEQCFQQQKPYLPGFVPSQALEEKLSWIDELQSEHNSVVSKSSAAAAPMKG